MRNFAIMDSHFFRFFIGWHFLAIIFSLIIGLDKGDYNLFLSLSIWTIIAIIAYRIEPPYYILSAFILSAIEETIIYSFGGGLQGAATSLIHDYLNSLPIFFSVIIVWYFVLNRFKVTDKEFYTINIIITAFVELLFQGILFDPILLFLLGGPAFFIYSSILMTPKLPEGTEEFTLKIKILVTLLLIIAIIFAAIVMTDINKALGY